MGGEHTSAAGDSDRVAALTTENRILARRLAREREIRRKAEQIAEDGLRALYSKQRELEFMSEITAMANGAGSVREVLFSALEYICRFLGWTAGHAHIVAGDGPSRRMWPSDIWYCDPALDLTDFRNVTAGFIFAEGEGLPGRVWASGESAWAEDLMREANFPRRDHAIEAGLRSAVITPLLIEREVVASLEFFGTNPTPANPALLRLIGQAGTQLGRVIERDRARGRLHDALHDALTELPNRPHFVREVDQAFREFVLDRNAGFCVLFVDLDRFKMINDSLGHAAGDVLITQVAARLKAFIRDEQFSAEHPRIMMARMGGDEFTVLVRDVADAERALAVADRIMDVLREPFLVEGYEVVTTASIGIALSSDEHHSADEMLRHADMAMYRAKARGKARAELYDASMQAWATRRLDLLSELQAAVRDEALELRFQPIISLDDKEVAGAEALVRWRTSPTTLRYPGEFIGIAEETGLIVPIGIWVLQEACRAVRRWNDDRAGKTPLTVSVNLSARQFSQPDLVETVAAVLAETGVNPEWLRLEITETVMIEDVDYTAEVLNRLCALGVRISIDDFGTGFSSLSYLYRFPLQGLKIDRSFVSRMQTSPDSLQIVKTIVVLARSLGMETIAEGAETPEAVALLYDLDCNYCQGDYFAAALPADELDAFLREPIVPLLP